MNAKAVSCLVATWILSWCAGCDRGEAVSLARGTAGVREPLALSGEPLALESPAAAFAAPRPVPVFSRDAAPLFTKYCLECHDRSVASGGVVLEGFGDEVPAKELRPLLLRVAQNVRSQSMPPEDEPRPSPAEIETLIAWIDAACGPDESRRPSVTTRRLNRTEYNNTVRDLIGLDLHPADEFPPDDLGYGFDNIGDVLAVPPMLVEMYVAAAERIVGAAFRTAAVRQQILTPPADAVPLAFRKYKPPVTTPRGDKTLRLARVAEDPELKRQQHIYDLLRAFADRAFRRPVTHDELMRLLGIVLSAEKDGESPDSALQLALCAALVSPHFLFRLEGARDPDPSGGPLPPNDFGLAARLSYFLWSSMPDPVLFGLAARGELRRPGVLRAQALRMLGDPRAQALSLNFAAQWLQTRRLVEVAPDSTLFPDFDEALRAAMIRETQLFCRSIQDEDRSILDFLDAGYTFVNERLARHYGMAGVSGEEFRRISLTGTPRGGLLTQASILTATSNPTRTSPVKRGKWILENILGAPPAPPPSGVEALKEASSSGSTATLRDQIERHRRDATCASCHRRMDPLGFALENFDAVGAWRTHEDSRTIDATARLAAGHEFRGADGLRALLRTRQSAFARCLADKMLIYALGRGLDRSDARAVDRIVEQLASRNYRFSALVLAIVESDPFREPADPGGHP
jgi:Protein of unknown function (DUF1592)/Protein of unknown function (DUF1588)/Protein of unknown function (DUF1585)/Protein of unknown function (DUF1587)/Protein of unknown function (DUF1595)/Cytochrome C oxidase, cbb3-type, subunit III